MKKMDLRERRNIIKSMKIHTMKNQKEKTEKRRRKVA